MEANRSLETELRDKIEAAEARIAELEARVFSFSCKECGDKQAHPLAVKSLHCATCGKPMSHVVGQVNPTYAELKARIAELEATIRYNNAAVEDIPPHSRG